jgi:hypothetical protein
MRVAVLPPHNLSGSAIDPVEISSTVEAGLARLGVGVIERAALDRFLAERRIRFTGGIDLDAAAEVRDELGADAVLVTVVERYAEAPVPQFAVSFRLVAARKGTETFWSDAVSISGDESPGLLDLGRIHDLKTLRERAIERCISSLRTYLGGARRPGRSCDDRRFEPRISFRSDQLDRTEPFTVAVLPFVNDSERRDAGDVVALTVYRELLRTGRFQPFEPGYVRRLLLGLRVIQEEGVTLEEARVLAQAIGADLVIAGRVYTYFENPTAAEAPRVEFAVTAIHRGDKKVYWQSLSYAEGDQGIHLFGLGKTATSGTLACQMASAVAHRMAKH